jgi:carboxylesterase type B
VGEWRKVNFYGFPIQEQNPSKPYPVIVFVHGAAFIEGNANGLNGSRLLKNDIILVTMNYRLGIFGRKVLN